MGQCMRDFRDASSMAQTLRTALTAMGFGISVGQSLELIAQTFGVSDWRELSAAIRSEASASTEGPGIPDATFNPISPQLESMLNQIFAYAKGRKHEEVTVEHILLFLLEDADTLRVVKGCGVDPGELQKGLNAFMDNELKAHARTAGENPEPDIGFQRVLQRAFFRAHGAGRLPVTSMNMLLAIFSEKDSYAARLLAERGMASLDAINFISHGTRKASEDSSDSPSPI